MRSVFRRLLWFFNIVWAVVAMSAGAAIGATNGFAGHGLDGAVALGFVGLIVGGVIASAPSLLLEICS